MTYAGSTCPQCGYKFDAFTRIGGERYEPPDIGSLGICINCGDIHKFTITGMQALSHDEWVEAMGQSNIRKSVEAIQALKRSKA